MKKILIVDDEEDMVWSLQKNLGTDILDLDIFTARSGEEAIELLRSIPMDLIITDIRMPGMSGLDLLLETKKISPQTRVIIMTAYPSPEFKKDALCRGCLHFIEKPFDIRDLRAVVRQALEEDKGFKGTVTGIELTDIVQINCISRVTAALRVRTVDREGILFFKDGRIVHAICGNYEGEEAFYEILGFEGGTLESIRGAESPVVSIDRGFEALLMEGLRRLDETRRDLSTSACETLGDLDEVLSAMDEGFLLPGRGEGEQGKDTQKEREEQRVENFRNTLTEFTKIDGVVAACLVGRDGFLIDSIAPAGVDTEMMGAISSTGLGSAESMGRQLAKGRLSMCMIEYDGGSVIVSPVGEDAFLAIIAEDKANLGMIRFLTKKHRERLSLTAIG